MAFSGGGAFSGGIGGAGAGAAIGAKVGAAGGPIGALGGAAFGTLAGVLGGGLLGSKKRRVPDISAEIAQIRALYEQQRQAAIAGINRQAALGRSAAASNLAVRGVYSSPVSERTFGALEDARLASIGEAEGRLAGAEAGAMSELLRASLGARAAIDEQEAQERAGLLGSIAGLGTSLLTSVPFDRTSKLGKLNLSPQPAAYSYGAVRDPLSLSGLPNYAASNRLLFRALGGRNG